MVFQRGACAAAKANWSVISRIDGRGGKMYSFWAMYSLRMSFCSVPLMSRAMSTPWASATARYMAKRIGAVELMVMEVVTSSSGMPSKRTSMSARLSTATPHLPTSPRDMRWSES